MSHTYPDPKDRRRCDGCGEMRLPSEMRGPNECVYAHCRRSSLLPPKGGWR